MHNPEPAGADDGEPARDLHGGYDTHSSPTYTDTQPRQSVNIPANHCISPWAFDLRNIQAGHPRGAQQGGITLPEESNSQSIVLQQQISFRNRVAKRQRSYGIMPRNKVIKQRQSQHSTRRCVPTPPPPWVPNCPRMGHSQQLRPTYNGQSYSVPLTVKVQKA